jgi:CRISPR/Cas system-associated endonuclease Cas1
MQSSHLEIEDGIGPERRTIRLARIGHGLKRLVCISEDGFATLGALKWLADVGASFVMLNRTGKVLFVTGPTASSDVRLRRAQALAHSSGAALRIARELIDQKLAGQERVARDKLLASPCVLPRQTEGTKRTKEITSRSSRAFVIASAFLPRRPIRYASRGRYTDVA